MNQSSAAEDRYSSIHIREDNILSNIHQSHYLDYKEQIFSQIGLQIPGTYYYCVTGLPKSIYRARLGMLAGDYARFYDNAIYPAIQALMEKNHVRGKAYMIIDDTKMIGIIFQLTADSPLSPLSFARRVQSTLQEIYIRFLPVPPAPYSNTTALSAALHSDEDLYYGCLKTIALKKHSFFHMSSKVLTEESVAHMKNTADYETITGSCQRVCSLAARGNWAACSVQLSTLFLDVLKNSFDFELVGDSLFYFKNFLHIRFTVYEIDQKKDLSTLCNLQRYVTIEECCQALLPAFDRLCLAVNQSKPYSNTVTLAAYYIQLHIKEDISLTDMAEYTDTTPSHLSKVFHQQMGSTVKQYQTEARIRRAKKLLANTALPVSEIANQCGIRDRRYFSELFKKATGVTPQQYRIRQTR